jgi:hypothetical protein
VTRRRSLPGADELFRATGSAAPAVVAEPDRRPARPDEDGGGSPERVAAVALAPVADLPSAAAAPEPIPPAQAPARSTSARGPVRRRQSGADRRPTGRERHEEKITVYVSAEELLDLEQARLTLRADHGLAVDRGRIVREALAVVLADLEAKGEASILVRRLHGR